MLPNRTPAERQITRTFAFRATDDRRRERGSDSLERVRWDISHTLGRVAGLATVLRATDRRGEAVACDHITAQLVSIRERIARLDTVR